MTADFSTVFGENQNILKSITDAMSPIVAAGANQQGFSAPELTSMNSQAQDLAAKSGQQAEIAAAAKQASAGGSAFTPSGATEEINAMINQQAKQQEATAKENITQENYATGRQNFFNAETALAGAPAATSTAGTANAVTGAGTAATGGAEASMAGATQIQQANDAWIGPVAGIIGGLGSAYLGKKP